MYLYFTTNYQHWHVNIYHNYIIKHSILVIPILKTNTIDVLVFTAECHITHVYTPLRYAFQSIKLIFMESVDRF